MYGIDDFEAAVAIFACRFLRNASPTTPATVANKTPDAGRGTSRCSRNWSVCGPDQEPFDKVREEPPNPLLANVTRSSPEKEDVEAWRPPKTANASRKMG